MNPTELPTLTDDVKLLRVTLSNLANAFHEGRAGPLQKESTGYVNSLLSAAESVIESTKQSQQEPVAFIRWDRNRTGTDMNVQEQITIGHSLIGLMPNIAEHALIGSATYMPAPEDIDFAVLLGPNEDAMQYATQLCLAGWDACGDYDTSKAGEWCAVRRGHINLMLTHSRPFYDRYKTAMEVCRALRLQHKEDRIAVCQIVRDGKTADECVMTTAIQVEKGSLYCQKWGRAKRPTLPEPSPCKTCGGKGIFNTDGEGPWDCFECSFRVRPK